MADRPKERDPDRLRSAVRAVMQARGLNPYRWARKAGRSAGVLRPFLDGKTRSLTSDTLEALADAAGVSVAVLTGEAPLNGAATGNSAVTREGPGLDVAALDCQPPAYWLRLGDGSMQLAGVPAGCYLVADPTVEPVAGDVVVVELAGARGEAQLLVREYRPPLLVARSVDPRHESLPLGGDRQARVAAVVLRFYHLRPELSS